jgi:hypothetical protein
MRNPSVCGLLLGRSRVPGNLARQLQAAKHTLRYASGAIGFSRSYPDDLKRRFKRRNRSAEPRPILPQRGSDNPLGPPSGLTVLVEDTHCLVEYVVTLWKN